MKVINPDPFIGEIINAKNALTTKYQIPILFFFELYKIDFIILPPAICTLYLHHVLNCIHELYILNFQYKRYVAQCNEVQCSYD